jgi:murein DD-endopeptidase MepM/ murein hydrolase activator NlpD
MKRLYWVLALVFVVSGCEGLFADPSIEYTVERGDTLGRIAKHHGVTVDELRQWNGISGDLIEVGQVISIRTEAAPQGASSAKKTTRPKSTRKVAPTLRATGLRMPTKRKCLAGPSIDTLSDDEPDMQASAGLSTEQVRVPLAAFLPKLGRCFEGSWPTATVDFEITAGCNGRVSRVVVLDGGGVDGTSLECMRTTLSYVGLPAHDMPDGMTFRYPVTLGS